MASAYGGGPPPPDYPDNHGDSPSPPPQGAAAAPRGADADPDADARAPTVEEEGVMDDARRLLSLFVTQRLEANHVNLPPVDELIEGQQLAHGDNTRLRELGAGLQHIGDQLDRDELLQQMIDTIPANKASFFAVVNHVFDEEGGITWGRVVMVFYFAYKLILKYIDSTGTVAQVIKWAAQVLLMRVVPWIISRGGWDAIGEYFGTPAFQATAVFVAGCISAVIVYYWKSP